MAKPKTKKPCESVKFAPPLTGNFVENAPESTNDPAPEIATQARETADEYIAREYGEAIRAGNVARMLEGILVEIVKWRIGK